MIKRALGVLWWLIKLPVRLVLLPYRIVSTVVSILLYLLVLAIVAGVVYVVVL